MTDFKIPLVPTNKNGDPIAESGIDKLPFPSGVDGSGVTQTIRLVPTGFHGQAYKVHLAALPDAQFYADETGGCAPMSIAFSATDTTFADSVVFDFGDGVTSGDLQPTHEYTSADLYTVKLTAYGDLALANDALTRTDYIEILNPPIADFSAGQTSGTSPFSVSFTADCDGDVSAYLWNFGDGATSGSQNPTHQYTAGTFDVTLIASNTYCSDSETKNDYIVISEAGGQWVDKTSDTYWTAEWSSATWDGSKWTISPYEGAIVLRVNGSWASGYRPTRLRVTGQKWDGQPDQDRLVTLRNIDYSYLCEIIDTDWTTSGGNEIGEDAITYDGDMVYIYIQLQYVTKIEFWEE